MFDKAVDPFAPRRKDSGPVSMDGDGVEDLVAFGWLRGVQERAIMLEIRHKDGRVTAKGYSWLQSAEFDPSSGITLNFSGETVTLRGRNLNAEARPNIRLFAGILRHRVPCDSGGRRDGGDSSREGCGGNRRSKGTMR
jgi:hypothetical protein